MLSCLCDTKSGLQTVTAIISDICNGALPPAARDMLLRSRLIGIPKPAGGIRPISIGEIMYRLACSYVIGLLGDDILRSFRNIQKGVGTNGGADRALHYAQMALDFQRYNNPILLSVDISNAFNSIDRHSISHSLYTSPHTAPLWRLFDWSYSSPSELCVYDSDGIKQATILSSQGVKQGDPLSSFLFAHTIQRVYEAAVADLPGVTAVAYLDDLQLIGDQDSVLIAYDRLNELLSDLGLNVNPHKCHCLWPHPVSDQTHLPPPSLQHALTDRGIIFHHGFLQILGGPIGFDSNQISKWCLEQIRAHDSYFNLLSHSELSAHHAFLLLKASLRPRINYLMRCTPPSLFSDALQHFNDQINRCLHTKVMAEGSFNLFTSEFASRQLRLPNRQGGIGLSDLFASSHAAYLSSSLLTLPDLLHLLPADPSISDHDLSFLSPLTLNHMLSSSIALRESGAAFPDGSNLLLPSTLEGLLNLAHAAAGMPPLQHTLMSAIHSFEFNDLLTTGTDTEVARLIAATSPHANAWLHLDSTNRFPLEPDALAFAISHRLGLTRSDIPATSRCPCGGTFTDSHPFTCRLNTASGCGERHNLIRDKLAALCRHHALLDVIVEPNLHHMYPSPHRQHRLRPDLIIRGCGRDILVDVSVFVPMMDSYSSNISTARTTSRVMQSKEQQKTRKYKKVTKKCKGQFFPFVVESTGGFGPSAIALLHLISRQASRKNPNISATECFRLMLAELANSLQRGNLQAVNESVQLVINHSRKRYPRHSSSLPSGNHFTYRRKLSAATPPDAAATSSHGLHPDT